MEYNNSLVQQVFVTFLSFLSLSLSFWVYLTNRKSKVNYFFFWLGIGIFFLIIFSHLGNTSTDLKLALLFYRLAYGVTILFFIPFYFFTIYFFQENEKFLTLNKFVLTVCSILFLFSILTDLLIRDVEFTKFGIFPVYGGGKFLYFGSITLFTLFILSRFLINYFRFTKEKKRKIQYFLLGFFPWVLFNIFFIFFFPLSE